MGNIKASEIADFLGKKLIRNNIEIDCVCSIFNPKENGLTFWTGNSNVTLPENTVAIGACIQSDNPKLDFARVVTRFFPPVNTEPVIGEGTIIEENVNLQNVTIGRNCHIKSGSVIGQRGFGFVLDENKRPFPFPHIGHVVIGNNVEIGALNTIARGAIDNTVISNYVKTDDHVHIAHNVTIGENTMIAACTEISGSVNIGRDVWISPQVSILDHKKIGDKAFVCISSVVCKDVKSNTKVFGNPARVV